MVSGWLNWVILKVFSNLRQSCEITKQIFRLRIKGKRSKSEFQQQGWREGHWWQPCWIQPPQECQRAHVDAPHTYLLCWFLQLSITALPASEARLFQSWVNIWVSSHGRMAGQFETSWGLVKEQSLSCVLEQLPHLNLWTAVKTDSYTYCSSGTPGPGSLAGDVEIWKQLHKKIAHGSRNDKMIWPVIGQVIQSALIFLGSKKGQQGDQVLLSFPPSSVLFKNILLPHLCNFSFWRQTY